VESILPRSIVMTGDEQARVRIIVSGRVQGVFFRRAAAEQARTLGVNGFARNLDDGSVEIVGEGKRRNLEMLLAWARKGPPHARVDAVQAQWEPYRGEFAQFRVR
jgi:acylphosphatase